MVEHRIIEIEMKLTHQEDLLAKLNEIVTDQQQQITNLERLCAALKDEIRTLAASSPSDNPRNERPPHY